MTTKPTQLAAAIAATVSLSFVAQAQADQNRFYLNPFAGYQHFDDQRDLDNSNVYGVGLEMRMLPRWAVEAVFSYSEPDQKYVGGDVTFREVRVDGLHYFGTPADRWNPYLAVGFGKVDFKHGPDLDTKGSYHDEAQVNAGGGLRYNVNDRFALRADIRGFHGINESTFDARASLGFSLALNEVRQPAPAPAPAPEPAPAAAPAPAPEPAPEPEVVTLETITLYVTFPVNSAQIGAEYDEDIREIAEALEANPEVTVEIAGHSDSTGRADYNLDLSQRRAESVAQRLISIYGIEGQRVTPVGYGEAEPIASNETREGRAQNRRVEARIQIRR